MKTYNAKEQDVTKKWYLVDASDKIVGRMAPQIAMRLRGKHKAIFTPHADTGDFVVVVNADKIVVTGRKEEQKKYMFYSGYFGNEKYVGLKDFRERRPEFIIEHAVKGMMPRNRLARAQMKKLKIYGGAEHPHESQNPVPYSA